MGNEAHVLGGRVKSAIRAAIPGGYVLVHMEPVLEYDTELETA